MNIFGGIMQCDVIARGCCPQCRASNALGIRLEGTNVEGKAILAESGIACTPADSLAQAAEIITSQVNA